MRPQATAWFAPLPPALVKKEEEVIVSPGPGTRGVTETISAFREPITRMRGGMLGNWCFLVVGVLVLGH